MAFFKIFAALAAVSKAAQFRDGKDFSRKSTLTAETVIRLLIGAEGGSLAKILHDAGIQATASALSQRRAQIPSAVFRAVFDRFNSACVDTELFRGYRLLAVDGTISAPRLLFRFMAARLAPAEQPAGMPSAINCKFMAQWPICRVISKPVPLAQKSNAAIGRDAEAQHIYAKGAHHCRPRL